MFRREQIGYGWLGVMYAGEDANGRTLRMFPIRRLSSLMREEIQYRHRLVASKPILKAFPALGIQMVHGTPYWIGGWKNGVLLSVAIEEYQIPFQVVIAIAVQILESLYDAKQKGCIHGDLDPKCIWLTTTGEVWIEGYGQKIHNDIPNRFSDMAYVAPSGLAHSSSDVYSLGTILIHALLQKKPEIAADDSDIHRIHVRQMYEALKQLEIPKHFAQQVARLIGFEADKRPSIERILSKWRVRDADIVIASWLRESFPYMYLPGRPEERIPQTSMPDPSHPLKVDLNQVQSKSPPSHSTVENNKRSLPIIEEWDPNISSGHRGQSTPKIMPTPISSNPKPLDISALDFPKDMDWSALDPLDNNEGSSALFLGEDTINLDDDLSIDFQDLGQLNDDVFANVMPTFEDDFFTEEPEDTVVLNHETENSSPRDNHSNEDVLVDDDTFIMQKNPSAQERNTDWDSELIEPTMEVPVFKNEPEYSLEDEFFFETTQNLVDDDNHSQIVEQPIDEPQRNWLAVFQNNRLLIGIAAGSVLLVWGLLSVVLNAKENAMTAQSNQLVDDVEEQPEEVNPQEVNEDIELSAHGANEVLDTEEETAVLDEAIENEDKQNIDTEEPEVPPAPSKKSVKPVQKAVPTVAKAKPVQKPIKKNVQENVKAPPNIAEPSKEVVAEEKEVVAEEPPSTPPKPVVLPKGKVQLKGDVGSIRLYRRGKDYSISQYLEVGEYEIYVKFDTWQEMSMGKVQIQADQTAVIRCDSTMKICKVK